MTKEEIIGEEINKQLKVNIYKNCRKLELVDARSLYCYILRKDLNYTLYNVRDSLRKKGKYFDHCSVLHMIKIYDEVVGRKPHFKIIRDALLGKVSTKHLIIRKVEAIDDEDKLQEINKILNNY